MAVVISNALGDPQAARIQRARKVPRAEFSRAQPFDVPDVKKFMRYGAERVLKCTGISERARLNDLRRRQMLHAVTRPIVRRKVNQKSVGIKLRRPPHRRFGADNLLHLSYERRSLAA